MDKRRREEEETLLASLRKYLPDQRPLKDFIHHNTLHAFQHLPFPEAMKTASRKFGYRTYLPLEVYREKFRSGEIPEETLDAVLERYDEKRKLELKALMLHGEFDECWRGEAGWLYDEWRQMAGIHMGKKVFPKLFRWVGAYLDQGVASAKLPVKPAGFLEFMRNIQRNSLIPVFRNPDVQAFLFNESATLADLLNKWVGPEKWHARYIFDQQFHHPGWSGMVQYIEKHPGALIDDREISLRDFVFVELLLEGEVLGKNARPLVTYLPEDAHPLIEPVFSTELFTCYALWQEAWENTRSDGLLHLLERKFHEKPEYKQEIKEERPELQAVFCMDDRNESIRRHLESVCPSAITYGTAGYYKVDCFYQPAGAVHWVKSCPAPVPAKHLIREDSNQSGQRRVYSLGRHPHSLVGGWLFSTLAGWWSAVKLISAVFNPKPSRVGVSSFLTMTPDGKLQILSPPQRYVTEGVALGYTPEEMAEIVFNLLSETGITEHFARFVYIMGHGASSTNNTHYAGYDCGACSGKSGAVNARAFAWMANRADVRELVARKGLIIPEDTRFVGGIYDTTRDETLFFVEEEWTVEQDELHNRHKKYFNEACMRNACERAEKFMQAPVNVSPERLHEWVKKRAYRFFEPRPEWNHAGNAYCIIGRREVSRGLYLDRRVYLQSYDYRNDPDGKYLHSILQAVVPVAGGINLEYYFSTTDPNRLGAGSKLPHNVVGLFAVSNGVDGDLRTGLPSQMVNIHEPLRLTTYVEQYPERMFSLLEKDDKIREWFENKWIHLIVIHPESGQFYRYTSVGFIKWEPKASKGMHLMNLKNSWR